MALRLPEHSHCAHCRDPVPFGERFCSEECREGYKRDHIKDVLKDAVLYGTVALALIVLVYRII